MATELQQWQRRVSMTLVDEHGRKWDTVIDVTDKRKGACAPLVPKFDAPWLPDQKYLHADGNTMRVTIDYRRCIDDCEAAARAWDERLHDEAVRLFSTAAPQAIEKRDAVLMREVGPQPLDPRWARAAQAGNPWVLGKPGYRAPEWATALIAARVAQQQATHDELAYAPRDGAPPDLSDVEHYEDFNDAYDRQAVGGTKVKRGRPARAQHEG